MTLEGILCGRGWAVGKKARDQDQGLSGASWFCMANRHVGDKRRWSNWEDLIVTEFPPFCTVWSFTLYQLQSKWNWVP